MATLLGAESHKLLSELHIFLIIKVCKCILEGELLLCDYFVSDK